MCADRPITILHISDTQFGKKHRFGRLALPAFDDKFDTLLSRLGQDLDFLKINYNLRPDILILTGDLVQSGMRKEFDNALHFIEGITKIINLDRSRVVIVPGNHDVNWKACESYFNSCDADGLPPVPPFWNKWKYFSLFFNEFYKESQIENFSETKPWTLFEMKDLKVVVAGLNSTMAETHKPDDHYGWLGEGQMEWFADKLSDFKEKGWFRIGALHHNIRRGPVADDENLRDTEDLKRILIPHLNLILHGHTHDGRIEWFTPIVPILATGSAALAFDVRPEEIPNQYQIIQLSADRLFRWARQYEPMQKKWIGDVRVSEKGDKWYAEERVEFDNIFFTFPTKSQFRIKMHDCDTTIRPHDFFERPIYSLPPRPPLFLGRDEEINTILAKLKSGGCQYIYGPPGVGKTTLASEAVWRLNDHFQGRIMYYFSTHYSYNEILNFIARAFLKNSIVDLDLASKEREIERFLFQQMPVLLFFDNVDNINIVKSLEKLSKCCSVMITSRLYAPFGWLTTKNLNMMDNQSSAQLFEASYGSPLSENDKKYLEQILNILDGMPLAINLLATRAKVSKLSIETLPSKLKTQLLSMLEILNISVEASIGLTYDILDDHTKRFFCMLSLFEGRSFSIEAASAMWEKNQGLRKINHLTDLSLIKPVGSNRFILHPIIQEFSLKKLIEFNDINVFLDRMIEYYIKFVESYRTDFSMLESERENILEIMKRCEINKDAKKYLRLADSMLKMYPGHYAYGYLPQKGYWEEAKEIVERCLTFTQNPVARAKLYEHIGLFYYWKGELNQAERSFEMALELCQKNKDYYGEAIILQRLGFIKCDEGMNNECECLYRQSLKIAKQRKLPSEVIATGLHLVGAALYNRCLYEDSRKYYEEALKIRMIENSVEVAVTQRRLAGTLRRLKETDSAERLLLSCLEIEKRVGNKRNIARTLRQIGMICLEKNELDRAHNYLYEGYSIFEKIGNKKGIASVLTNLGELDVKKGRINEAICKLQESLKLAIELLSVYGVAINLRWIAEAYYQITDYKMAAKHAFEALEHYEKIDHVHVERVCEILNGALLKIKLEETCKISLPTVYSGKYSEAAAKKFQKLWTGALVRYNTKNVLIDKYLYDRKSDDRLGISLIVRLSDETNRLFARVCNRLKTVAPDHHYYNLSEFHVTVLTIINAEKPLNCSHDEIKQMTEFFTEIFSEIRPVRIRFKGIGITEDCVIAYGFFIDGTIDKIRDEIRSQCKKNKFEYQLDERYRNETAHVTMVRYRSQKNLESLLNEVERIKDCDLGVSPVNRIDLVVNDWFMSEDKVKLLNSFELR
jgi:tetratricopeptide (TPR) repeat protein/2'-5' RNA ligase/predicted MPP superfamily phosphohydrolase